ncbi:unnamed protein product [Caenorhabditis brenneri]
MILIYLLLILIARLGVQGNVVDVPVGTILMQEKVTRDDRLYAIKSCSVEPCGLEQFICKKNFLLPANKILSATATVVFKLNYKIEYMGEQISDVAEFPFTLDKNYYSFTFRYGKGSSIRLSASKTCRTMDGNYFDTNCHYHCERRNWDAKTHRKRIEVKSEESVWAVPSVGDKSCSIPRFGTATNTSPHCIPSPGCAHGSCLIQDGVVYEATCDCDPGYYGTKCDHNSICHLASPCRKGKCLWNENNSTEVACQCEAGFTGRHCEKVSTQPQFCRKNSDCKNGGQCIQRPRKNSYCECPDGFVGDFCEVPYQCPYKQS